MSYAERRQVDSNRIIVSSVFKLFHSSVYRLREKTDFDNTDCFVCGYLQIIVLSQGVENEIVVFVVAFCRVKISSHELKCWRIILNWIYLIISEFIIVLVMS